MLANFVAGVNFEKEETGQGRFRREKAKDITKPGKPPKSSVLEDLDQSTI